jgi:hypothetical protein
MVADNPPPKTKGEEDGHHDQIGTVIFWLLLLFLVRPPGENEATEAQELVPQIMTRFPTECARIA